MAPSTSWLALAPSDYLIRALRQQGASLTFGVFIGAALTSGAVCGAAAFVLANEALLRRLRQSAAQLVVAARDAALQTAEGRAIGRAVLSMAPAGGVAADNAGAAPSLSRVRQTILEAPHGNALQACVASLLGLPLEAVPNFVATTDYWAAMRAHAASVGPLTLLKLSLDDGALPFACSPGTLCVARGASPRGPHGHVIVAAVAPDGRHLEEVHDPWPDGGGLAGPAAWAAFYVCGEPSRVVGAQC